MKISYQWLKEFVEFDLTPEQLADTLTALGLEAVVETPSYAFDGVVVGKLLEVAPIAGTDRLTLCQVDIGSEVLPVVCGAPNVSAGILVPVATVGAHLADGAVVKRTRLRRQESRGNICAEDELGLSDDHSGIMILDQEAGIGSDFKEYLIQTREVVLDIDLTPNRGDCLSHLGVARDLAAKLDTTVRYPPIDFPEGSTAIADLAKVNIRAADGCHRYAARVIQGVKIAPSPPWLVRRLRALEMRAINNVVDASNYVLMELGHPLHIFDYDRITGHEINVHFAEEGQRFTTLDGQERVLGQQHLLIADGQGPVALAGIMGGQQSEVTDQTTELLIESAYFAPTVIRKGSKSLDLRSEASHRFERDTDIEGLITALDRVTALIVELAGGTVARGIVDQYPVPHKPRKITLSGEFTNRLLGTRLSLQEMRGYLRRLGITVSSQGDDQLSCTVPLNRPELTLPVDLIEEIARLHGYDNIASGESAATPFRALRDDSQAFFSQVRRLLVGWGHHEHYGNTLTRRQFTQLYGNQEAVTLQNPLSAEMTNLRTSLIPGLLQAIGLNARHGNPDPQLFEIGAVHHLDGRRYNRSAESFMVAGVTPLSSAPLHWKQPPPRDLYSLKGVVTQLLRGLGCGNAGFEPVSASGFITALEVRAGEQMIGIMGLVAEDERQIFDLEGQIAAFELNLESIGRVRGEAAREYHEIIPYPIAERDIALEVPLSTTAEDLLLTIRKSGGKFLKDVQLFDLYSGEGLTAGNKSLAFRLFFQSAARTMRDQEMDRQVKKITTSLERRHSAHWRQG